MVGKVGYACINEHLRPLGFRSCRLRTIESRGIEYLKEVILHNIQLTKEILEWNSLNLIFMYRVSSDLMPLVTHEQLLNDHPWRWYEDQDVLAALYSIRKLVKNNDIRLSMHPDQYTVLNSNKPLVVEKSILYLDYHAKILECMGGKDMIVHVGGVYGDKDSGMKRFVQVYHELSPLIKRYLRLENDDKSYNIHEVLEISYETSIPIVFDLHHHRCLLDTEVTVDLLDKIEATWVLRTPKIHISSGKSHSKDRSHHDYISVEDCRWLSKLYAGRRVDVMVEAKKKDYAAMGLISYLNKGTMNRIDRISLKGV